MNEQGTHTATISNVPKGRYIAIASVGSNNSAQMPSISVSNGSKTDLILQNASYDYAKAHVSLVNLDSVGSVKASEYAPSGSARTTLILILIAV